MKYVPCFVVAFVAFVGSVAFGGSVVFLVVGFVVEKYQ